MSRRPSGILPVELSGFDVANLMFQMVQIRYLRSIMHFIFAKFKPLEKKIVPSTPPKLQMHFQTLKVFPPPLNWIPFVEPAPAASPEKFLLPIFQDPRLLTAARRFHSLLYSTCHGFS